ncbi:MAG: nicotinate-nucleotide--dimethylbenzimidazole phosphoribosyltransferase [Litorimonas sp.]
MSPSAKPFDDIRALLDTMPQADIAMHDAVLKLANHLGRELRPLGTLDQHLAWLAAWQGSSLPRLQRPLVAVFAGTHGVAKSLFGDNYIEQSKARVQSLTDGAAAVRGIAADAGAAFKVYEFGIEHPSEDFKTAPSLSERDCAAALAFGMEVVAEGADVIVLGSAGLGAAAAAAGLAHGLFGGGAEYWAGGSSPQAKQRVTAVEQGAQSHKDMLKDPLDILRLFGGRDLAGIVGAIIAARHQRIPVILDGYVVCAAAAVLHQIDNDAVSHCIAAHVSAEPAHQALLDRLDMQPILDLELNIGDGTGGALAMHLLKAASMGLSALDND